jgi:ATP-binding cassette, subfamily B, bacterial MsbA
VAAERRGREVTTSRIGWRLLAWLRPYRWTLSAGIVATSVASVLDGVTLLLLIPLLRHLFGSAGGLAVGGTGLEQLVDRMLAPILSGGSPAGVTVRLVLLLWVVLLMKNLLAWVASQLSVLAQEGLVRDLRAALFGHLLRLDLGWLERTRGGQVIARVMHDADQAKVAISAGLASFFQNLVLILTTLAVLSQLSWRLTLLTLAAAPILLGGIRVLLRRLRHHARARAEAAGEMTATVAERLTAMKLIRAYGGEAREAARFREQADHYRRRVARTQRLATLSSPVSEIFGGLLLVALVAVGASSRLMGGALAPEALLVFIVAALRVMAPLKAITQFPSQMSLALTGLERVFEVLDRPATEPEHDTLPTARFEREIVFERVWFAYERPPFPVPRSASTRAGPTPSPAATKDFAERGTRNAEPWVLCDISFTLPRGKTVALVGPSGAGKTTLAELLPRLREPLRGRILIDGAPIAGFSRASVRGLLGFVGQETVLLNDTVEANIGYGRPGASRAQIEAAARAANAHAFISQLPEGYQTLLGERGTRLSGGQRQRVAIARALLRDPPILILDEATSALDSESERLVQDALLRLMQDRTVLVIAHRLATVRHADEILVLDEGRVVERGTHEDLRLARGLYSRLLGSSEFRVPSSEGVLVETTRSPELGTRNRAM